MRLKANRNNKRLKLQLCSLLLLTWDSENEEKKIKTQNREVDNPKQRKNRPTYNTVHTASNSPNMKTPKENMSHPKEGPH